MADLGCPAFFGAAAAGLAAGVGAVLAGPPAVAVASAGHAAFQPGAAASVAVVAFQPAVVVVLLAFAAGREPAAVAVLGEPELVAAAAPCPAAVAEVISVPVPPAVVPAATAVPDLAATGFPGRLAAHPAGICDAVGPGGVAALTAVVLSSHPLAGSWSGQRHSPETGQIFYPLFPMCLYCFRAEMNKGHGICWAQAVGLPDIRMDASGRSGLPYYPVTAAGRLKKPDVSAARCDRFRVRRSESPPRPACG